MSSPKDDLEYLRREREHLLREMLVSVDRFEQSELLFNWRTDEVRKRHGLDAGERLTVEAIIDRRNDELWQESVNDCRYYRDRAAMYAAVYAAATDRLDRLRRVVR